MAVVFALLSAVSYGLSDFVGGLVSRRTSAWPVAVVGVISAAACTAVVAGLVAGSPTLGDLAWGLFAGVGSGAGVGFLYRGFSTGRMGVVAPLSGVGAAAVPVLVGVGLGERPAVLVWVGLVTAVPGIWLVSRIVDDTEGPQQASLAEGVVDGLLAGLGFGVMFSALGQVPDTAGMWPLVLTQVGSAPTLVVLASALGVAWLPRERRMWWGALAGPLSAAATVTFLLATHRGLLTVTGVLSSLYPAATVILAAVVLRERVHRAQAAGLGLCAAAIALVAGG